MSQLTLPLPKTLHHELEVLADNEGVPLNEYILYILSRQVAKAYTVQVTPKEALEMQDAGFKSLLGKWGKASPAAVDDILIKREVVEPEPELSPDVVETLKTKIAAGSL